MSHTDLLAASTVGASTLTVDRIVATVAVLVALAGVVVGGLALARATRGDRDRTGDRRAAVAMVAGVAGLVVGALVVVTADGGPGTGNGIVGGYAALVLGLVAALLGALASARSRRTA